MTDFLLKTPVAFLVFNRPDTTEIVFNEIAKVRPPKLLVIGDGARENRVGEQALVDKSRAIIQKVDWPCEVLCNFSDINLGCKKRVSSGLDWVFEQVPEVIILEDDCVPDLSFFRFCEELLEKYRDNKSVAIISGNNFQFGRKYNQDSYYFSKYMHIWGWATWRDRWVGAYDVNMSDWPNVCKDSQLMSLLGDQKESQYWSTIFDKVQQGKIDTWDYQWFYANRIRNRLCILPSVNLVSNIGFGPEATHTTTASDFANLPRSEMIFPLNHPTELKANVAADESTKKRWFMRPIWKKILHRLVSFLN